MLESAKLGYASDLDLCITGEGEGSTNMYTSDS